MLKFKNWPIGRKLFLILFVSALGLLATAGIGLEKTYSEALNSRKQSVQEHVAGLISVMNAAAARAKAGEITDDEARMLALQAARDTWFAEDGYFFVTTFDHTLVAHGAKPEIEGRNMADFQDEDGVRLFRELVTAARNGGGFVSYLWPRAGSDEAVEKLSYGAPQTDWDWMVGTGVYIDDIDAVFWRTAAEQAGISFLILLAIGAVSFYVARTVRRPLHDIEHAVSRLAEGDHTVTVGHTDLTNEIGEICKSVSELCTAVRERDDLRVEAAEKEAEAKRQRDEERLRLANSFEESVGAVVSGLSSAANRDAKQCERHQLRHSGYRRTGEPNGIERPERLFERADRISGGRRVERHRSGKSVRRLLRAPRSAGTPWSRRNRPTPRFSRSAMPP